MLPIARNKKRSCSSKGAIGPSKLEIKRSRQNNAFNELVALRNSDPSPTLNSNIESIVARHNDPYVTKSTLYHLYNTRVTNATPAVPEDHLNLANLDNGTLHQAQTVVTSCVKQTTPC